MKSEVDIHNITMRTTLTEGLTVKYVAEPKAKIEGKELHWDSIPKREQMTVLGSINFQKPTPSSDLSVNGTVSYQLADGNVTNSLDFVIPFNFVEMIRETPMTTSEYFALWNSTKAEQKAEIKSTLRNTNLFADKVNKIFHVATVDINEACIISGWK